MTKYVSIFTEEVTELAKSSLIMKWRDISVNDWIPADKAKTLPLKDCYVEPRFVWQKKETMGDWPAPIDSVFEITNLPDAGKRAMNILIEGKEIN